MFKAAAVGLAALVLTTGAVGAEDGELTATFWNRYGTTNQYSHDTYTWPAIGTPAYSAGCEIIRFAEDGWALAYCPEDGVTYAYDPDGFVYFDHGILWRITDPGWTVADEQITVRTGA